MALTATAGSDSKRTIIVVIVVLLHLGMYYVIESGLSHQIISMLAKPIDTKMIEDQKAPEDLPPPPPPPDIAEPPPFIPPPDIMVQTQAATNAIQVVTNERPPVVAPPPVAPPVAKPQVSTPPGRGKTAFPDAQDYYPSASARRGDAGSVTVAVYVGTDGKVQDAKVDTSSGFPELDEAAVKYARRLPKLQPGTIDGVPQPMWWKFKVTFKVPK